MSGLIAFSKDIGLKLLLELIKENFSTGPMLGKLSSFRRLGPEGIGIENWFQSELIHLFMKNGIMPSVKDKTRLGGDIIVGDTVIELKAHANVYKDCLLKGIEERPKATLYMFLSVIDEDELKRSIDEYDRRGYLYFYDWLNEDWIVLIVSKK